MSRFGAASTGDISSSLNTAAFLSPAARFAASSTGVASSPHSPALRLRLTALFGFGASSTGDVSSSMTAAAVINEQATGIARNRNERAGNKNE